MICPHCGAENPDGSAHCNLCLNTFAGGQGRQVPPAPEEGPQAATAPPAAVPQGQGYGQPPTPGSGGQGPGIAGPLPPGANLASPSDAFAYNPQYQPPGPPPAQVKPAGGMNPTLMWAIRIVVIAVCFALGWFGMDYILSRSKTFTSTSGSFTFTYPGKWKKADPSTLALSGVGGTDMTMEVGLADVNSANPNYIFLAGSAIAPVDWATAKARLIQGYSQDLSSQVPQGATLSPRTFKDVTIGGKQGLSIRFSLTYQGITYDCDLTILQNGGSYQALMMMARQPGGKLDKFDSILKSFKFK